MKANQEISWNWKGLMPTQGYTIYFGAINEAQFEIAMKTMPYKIVFKAKINDEFNSINY